jgi:hypothetical protein
VLSGAVEISLAKSWKEGKKAGSKAGRKGGRKEGRKESRGKAGRRRYTSILVLVRIELILK